MSAPSPLPTSPGAEPGSREAVLHAIRHRRTADLRDLSPVPVPRATLQALLEAANWAPSHGRTEPWRFAVFTGAGRARLSEALNASAGLLNPALGEEARQGQSERQGLAPVWIAVAAEPAAKPRMPLHEEQWATVCAVHNLLLAATAHGLVGKWITNPPSMHPNTARMLGFPEEAGMVGVVYLGYPRAGWPVGTRRPVEDKVRWVEE
ncbi:nitroreductase family protein [Deinococcus planocerae]|uniref:nitroreductase family protein n=1 Tax=Deinococcus planocerae TaxID=1737569 RepID=UPI001FE68117|nr:nitroreductase [Deinococcus planocerae]